MLISMLDNEILIKSWLGQTVKRHGKIVPKFTEITKNRYKIYIGNFVIFLKKNLLETTEKDVIAYRNYLINTPMKNGKLRANRTVNTIINIGLSSFFTWACESRLIDKYRHPISKKLAIINGFIETKQVKPLPIEKEYKTKEYIKVDCLPVFSMAEDLMMIPLSRLEEKKDPRRYKGWEEREFRNHLYMLLMTRYGMRIGEPLKLLWDNIDFDSLIFLIPNRKNKEDTWFPLTYDVRDALLFFYQTQRKFRKQLDTQSRVLKFRDTGQIRKEIYEYQNSWESFYEFNRQRKESGKLPIAIHTPHNIFRHTWWTHIGSRLSYPIAKYIFGQRPPSESAMIRSGIDSIIKDSQDKDDTANIYLDPKTAMMSWGGDEFRQKTPEPRDKQVSFYMS